jgi:hypothetical protein
MARVTDKMLLEMIVDNKKALANINKVQKSGDKIQKSQKGLVSGIRTGWLKAAFAIGAVVTVFKGVFDATNRQQRAERQLNAVLESTGHVAGITAGEITKMAASLQKVTTFGDEAIIEGQNLLLTFKKIGEDVFPRATETMLDVATAMGQDMKTTAIQLGKALNDPIQGLTALRRVGITFEKEQEEVIKSMVKTGDIAKAQSLILNELESQFGGSARAAAEGIGVWKQVANAFSDLNERFGRSLAKLDGLAKFLIKIITPSKDIEDITQDLIKSQSTYTEVIKKLADEQDTLTTAEKNNLEIRKEVLELDIIKNINALNKAYEDQRAVIESANTVSDRRNEGLKTLRDRLVNSKEEMIKLSDAEAEILEITRTVNFATGLQNEVFIKRTDALRKFTSAQEQSKESTVLLNEEQQKLQASVDLIAQALIDETITKEQLLGLDAELLVQIQERIPLINEETEALRIQNEEKALEEEKAKERAELEKIRIEELEEIKKATATAEKKRSEERKKLIADVLKFQVDSEKQLTKLTTAELKKRKKEYELATISQAELSQTFVDGFLGGIESMASSSKDVLVSMIKSFVSMIAGRLAALSSFYFASLNIPAGTAALAAAATVKALGGTVAAKIVGAENGLDSAPGGPVLVGEAGPEIVNLPRGSQVIPNHEINMARFSTMPRFQEGGIVGGDTINTDRSIVIQNLELTAENPADFMDQLQNFTENVNVDILNP